MKKLFAVILTFAAIFSLASCGLRPVVADIPTDDDEFATVSGISETETDLFEASTTETESTTAVKTTVSSTKVETTKKAETTTAKTTAAETTVAATAVTTKVQVSATAAAENSTNKLSAQFNAAFGGSDGSASKEKTNADKTIKNTAGSDCVYVTSYTDKNGKTACVYVPSDAYDSYSGKGKYSGKVYIVIPDNDAVYTGNVGSDYTLVRTHGSTVDELKEKASKKFDKKFAQYAFFNYDVTVTESDGIFIDVCTNYYEGIAEKDQTWKYFKVDYSCKKVEEIAK